MTNVRERCFWNRPAMKAIMCWSTIGQVKHVSVERLTRRKPIVSIMVYWWLIMILMRIRTHARKSITAHEKTMGERERIQWWIDVNYHLLVVNVKFIYVKIVVKIIGRVQFMIRIYYVCKSFVFLRHHYERSPPWHFFLQSCPNGFYGNECQYSRCQSIQCQNHGQCQVELNKTVCQWVVSFFVTAFVTPPSS